MRRLAATVAILVSLLVACGKADSPPRTDPSQVTPTPSQSTMLTLSASDAARTIDVNVGQRIAVRLAGNRTTGYEWKLAGSELNVLRQIGEQTYTADPAPPGIVGRGGVEAWEFEATRSGREDLRFEYRRPWERDVPPADTVSYSINVR